MQIPLDYYRILGLPTQATPEQIQQAHRDRVLQLPRREYSDLAIAARRDLLDLAYTTLADPQRREAYQAHITQPSLSRGGGPETDLVMGVGTIDVADSQVIGALLILQELGEYELVLQVGIPLLPKRNFHPDRASESEILHADIALTAALSYLELGREYWQQGHYENAAESLETGQALLLKEGLFTGVRGEIKADLYKLRPYRVLELLALPLNHTRDRRKGIQVLRDMLQERGGIDGSGDDLSGLGIDDFLRFIQQLREYLTAEEQQILFEAEARRPSSVATYLAVYAFVGRGFTECQPELIQRAKPLLLKLAKRQDVHLEQAICALLLGQTEQASRALELSREYEAIAMIREQSQGSPDPLPGLCFYAEYWLQQEVFPHFRDLRDCRQTLKDYFANPQVQGYLEQLPQELGEVSNEWEVNPNQGLGVRPGVPNVGQPTMAQGYRRPTAAPALTPREGSLGLTPSPRRLQPVASMPPNAQGRGSLVALRQGSPDPTPNARDRSNQRQRGRRRGAAHGGDRSGHTQSSTSPLNRWLLLGGAGLLSVWSLVFIGSNLASWLVPSNPDQGTIAPGDGELVVRLDQPILTLPNSTGIAQVSVLPLSDPLTPATAEQLIQGWFTAKAKAMGSEHDLTSLSQILTGAALAERQQEAQGLQQEGVYVTYDHQVTVESIEFLENGVASSPDTSPPPTPNPNVPVSPGFTTLEPSPLPSGNPLGDPLANPRGATPLETGAPVASLPSQPSQSVGTEALVIALVDEKATFYQGDGQQDDSSSYNSLGLTVEYRLVRQAEGWRIQDMRVLR